VHSAYNNKRAMENISTSCRAMNPDFNPYEAPPFNIYVFACEAVLLVIIRILLYVRTPSSNVPVDDGGDAPMPQYHSIPMAFVISLLCRIGIFFPAPNVTLYLIYAYGLENSTFANLGAELACQSKSFVLGLLMDALFVLLTSALLFTSNWQAQLQYKMADTATAFLTAPAESAPTEDKPARLVVLACSTGSTAIGFVEKFAANVEAMDGEGSGNKSPLHSDACASEKKRATGLGSSLIEIIMCDAFETELCPTREGLTAYNMRQQYKNSGYNLVLPEDEVGSKKVSSLPTARNVQFRYTDFVTLPFASSSVDVLFLPRGFSIPYLDASLFAFGSRKDTPVDEESLALVKQEEEAGIDERLKKTEAFIKEIYRVLKPKGRLVLLPRCKVLKTTVEALTTPKTQSYTFCSLTPNSEAPDAPGVDVPMETFQISFIKAQVLGCVKHVVLNEVSADSSASNSLVQAQPKEGYVRHSMAFDGELQAIDRKLGELNVYLPQCGSLWILCHFLVFCQMFFFIFYVTLGLEFGERMIVPVWMPWSQTILNLYFGNTTVIPIMISFNYVEYTDLLYSKMSAAIKAGESVSTVNNADNTKLALSVLYYQTVDMFLVVFVFAAIGWIPNGLADWILIKGFNLSATLANEYNLYVSIFVIGLLVKLWKPAVARYKTFMSARGKQSDADALKSTAAGAVLANKEKAEEHPSLDSL